MLDRNTWNHLSVQDIKNSFLELYMFTIVIWKHRWLTKKDDSNMM